jgi:hypothetical protein
MNRRLYFLFESEKNFTGCSNFVYCRQKKAQINVESVVNMPRYGRYSQARIAIQLDRYQKDLGSV